MGSVPKSQRSDWTEQDLLTKEEALPRLESAMRDAEAELRATASSAGRGEIEARLSAMRTIRSRLT
jgi:hypothetical protein